MQKKLWFTYSLIVFIFSILIARLLYVVRNNPAQVASSQNHWTVTVSNSRGTIYDTDLKPFVNENNAYFAAIAPTESLLSHVRGATTIENFTELRDRLATGAPGAVRLTKPIGFTDGLKLFQTPVRYGDRLLAPHVIGYLDDGGINGVSGIELDYNALLYKFRGKATATFYVNGSGHHLAGILPEGEDTTNRSVGGVVLTLDKEIQQLVEEIGEQYIDKGAVVVLRPNDGEINAMASFPSFQPNNVAECINDGNGALLNRALSLYDCGSVFKIITTAAALEKGLSTNTTFECRGYLDVEGVRFHCHNRLGHGKLHMIDAFAQSCNLYYIQLADHIGAETVYSMATDFGLNESITLSNSLVAPKGLLPDPATITASKAALANFSFGQGYLMTTPLHIGKIAAVIVNDGWGVAPCVVKGIVNEELIFTETREGRGDRRLISSETAHTLRVMMESVVSKGTGQAAKPASCTAAGKTGTAETGQLVEGNPVTQSWFVGYFPAESPKYVVCLLVENADNSRIKSAELFQKIADSIYNNGTDA